MTIRKLSQTSIHADEHSTQHTPGPWKVKEARDSFHIYGSTWLIGATHLRGPTDAANARLIAAAPDLLAACKWADRELERLGARENDAVLGPNKAVAFIRAAIAKAEGR